MKEVEIQGTAYKIGKLNAFAQMYVLNAGFLATPLGRRRKRQGTKAGQETEHF